jgi:drug/metabolite transporter (DMT)-like permease
MPSERPHSAAPARADLGGYALVILAAFCYSTLAVFAKIAFREGMDAGSLLLSRFVLAAAILWALVLASPRLRTAALVPTGRRRWLFLWGMIGLAGQAALFFAALRLIPANLAEVLLYTCPAFLAIILWIRTRRRPRPAILAAISLALVGTWLVAAPAGDTVPAAGLALGLATGLWFASWVLALERASAGVQPIVSTTLVVTGTATTYGLIVPAVFGFAPPPTAAAWFAVAGMVIAATLLGFTFFVVGIRRTGSQVAAILSTLEPVGTLVLAAVVLGERFAAGQWLGAALVLGAAFVLAVRPGAVSPPDPSPAGAPAAASRPAAD